MTSFDISVYVCVCVCARARLCVCYLNLVANCSYIDRFRVELIHVEVQLQRIVVRLVDTAPECIAVHLHEELLQSTRSGRRRRSCDRRCLDFGTCGHQAEDVTVYVSHLVSESQLQPVHLLADVSDAEVNR